MFWNEVAFLHSGKQVCHWFVWDILQGVGLAQEVWVRGKQFCDYIVCVGHTTRSGPSTGSVGEGETVL